jgi:hypothetical protein
MHCSNCGKDIPYGGKVCPFCHADKSWDQKVHALTMVGGLIGGFLGFAVNSCGGAFLGFVVGAMLLIIIGRITGIITNGSKVATLPNLRATLDQGYSKVCCICGLNVSNRPRYRDTEGRYHCQTCWDRRSQPAPARLASPEYACSVCQYLFPADQVYDDKGVVICHACYVQQAQQYAPPVLPTEQLSVQASSEGYGRYRIEGVVKATGEDITTEIDAATRANAKVKAELQGIVVTAIDWIDH